MSIVLDGTTGLAGAATGALNGSLGATTPSTVAATTISGTDLTTTGNTILGNASTDTLNVGNGDLVKDASGNLGLQGAGSTQTLGSALQLGRVFSFAQDVNSGYIGAGWFGTNSGASTYAVTGNYAVRQSFDSANGAIKWFNAPTGTAGNAITFTERMKLTSDALTLGAVRIIINGASGIPAPINNGDGNIGTTAVAGLVLIGKGSSTDILFMNKNGITAGYVATGATTITTSSDERLKENFIPITDAVKTIAKLRKLTGNYKSNPTKNVAFFIAQDMKEAFPQAFVDANPDEFGVDYNWTIPLVAAGIDELSAQIKEQQALITNLSAKFEEYKASHP
jgi:hypothetical protein